MPPEAYLDGIFTSKSDVWAYGITLWEIFSMASDPYPGKVNQEVMQFVLDGGRLPSPENCPLSISYIMTCTWDSNPDVRPSFSTIVQKLQYCYEDPDTATYTLPTFTYNHSKVNFVELPDLHENSLSKRDAKKCSHPSLFSESLSEISEQHSSNRQINNDSNELSSCSDDIYKNSTKEGHQDISPEQCNRKGELLVPGIRSFINYLYMNQELPDPNNENTSQLDSRENSTENQADKNSDNNLLHSQHNHNHHLTTTSFPSPTPTPHTDHHHYHLQPQLQDSPRQSNPQSQQQSRSRSSSSSSSSSNNIKNHNNNSHNQQQPNMLELLQLDSLTKTSDFQNGEDKTNCRKQQQIQLQQQQQQQQHQQQQKQQQQQQELQLQQQQNLTEQEDDLNNKQQNEEPLQQQLEQLQETEEYDRYNADSFSLSPTKVPLLSSTDSDVSNYENDSFPKNSRCKSLRKSSQNSNYIPMRKVQDSPTESKYSNLDTNSI
ncbi:alpha-protein kinase 1 [Octopus bimaculoides]|nr:alpha-protein kinase 1 [Octopus bimaculoides]|eukprot:XP_014778553.1 PREDICTED: alpha-protein kinase 1-like [Octopus bimaculoides]